MEGEQAGWKKKLNLCVCVRVCMHVCIYVVFQISFLTYIQKAAENLSLFAAQFSRVKPRKKKWRIQQRDNMLAIHIKNELM